MSAISQTPVYDEQANRYSAARARLMGKPANDDTHVIKHHHKTIDVRDRAYPPKAKPQLPMVAMPRRERDWLKVASERAEKPVDSPRLVVSRWGERFGISSEEILGTRRDRHIVACRANIIAELQRKFGWSQNRVAIYLGKERTTITHAVREFSKGKYDITSPYWTAGDDGGEA